MAEAFARGSAVFVVTDQQLPIAWSIVPAAAAAVGLRAVGGRIEPIAVEISASFAVILQLLAGTLLVEDATARALITAAGDAAFTARLAPYIPETAMVIRAEDPASSS